MPFDNTNVTSPEILRLQNGLALIQKGWIKQHFWSVSGVCMLGGLGYRAGSSGWDINWDPCVKLLHAEIIKFYPNLDACSRGALITAFNDSLDTTKERVVAVYEKAIEAAKVQALEKALEPA